MSSLIDLPADDACVLYLIRHGATPHNLMQPPRLQGGGVNESLSEHGLLQAERAAASLADRPLACVVSSPLKRAVETAECVAKRQEQSVEIIDSLREANVGNWERKTWQEIQREDPVGYEKFRADPALYGYPGGDNLADLLKRSGGAIDRLMREHIGREIAVVAHSVVNRCYLGSLMGLSPAEGYKVPQHNCAINVIRYREGKAKVISINGVTHLM